MSFEKLGVRKRYKFLIERNELVVNEYKKENKKFLEIID